MNLGFSTHFTKGKTIKGKPTGFVKKIKRGSKKHTIRQDKNNRWRPGMPIHFCTGLRTKKYKCFKKGICSGTQKIRIDSSIKRIIVDGWRLSLEEMQWLAKNDGFKNLKQFFEYFNEPFEGKIIHWSKIRY